MPAAVIAGKQIGRPIAAVLPSSKLTSATLTNRRAVLGDLSNATVSSRLTLLGSSSCSSFKDYQEDGKGSRVG